MNRHQKRRLWVVLFLLIGLGLGVSLVLFALRTNINVYMTPTQVRSEHPTETQALRLGGFVLPHSIHHIGSGATIVFRVTDEHHQVGVRYTGVVPDLFRDGQGVIAEGHVLSSGVFQATRLLAKHDENYHPPNVSKAGGAA